MSQSSECSCTPPLNRQRVIVDESGLQELSRSPPSELLTHHVFCWAQGQSRVERFPTPTSEFESSRLIFNGSWLKRDFDGEN
jgi:hypothetical protein